MQARVSDQVLSVDNNVVNEKSRKCKAKEITQKWLDPDFTSSSSVGSRPVHRIHVVGR